MKTMSLTLMLMMVLFGCSTKKPETKASTPILTEAYTYGFPLVLMDLNREHMTNVSRSNPAKGEAPVNQFVHVTKLPTSSDKGMQRPNLDTLFSMAWLDLTSGPQVIEMPSTKGRYTFLPMIDGWGNVYATMGDRTMGNSPKKIVVVGPRWNGSIPAGVELVRSPTNLTWIVGRTEVKNAADAKAVALVQKQIKLYPLEYYGKKYSAPRGNIDSSVAKVAPLERVFALSTEEYFNRLNRLMLSNPPSRNDKEAIANFSTVGVAPGARFRVDVFSEKERSAIQNIPQVSRANFENNSAKVFRETAGWMMPLANIGAYGNNYDLRAQAAYESLATQLPQDAIFATAIKDGNGDKLSGSSNYILHFNKEELPKVKAFWSVTVYGNDSFLVKNSLRRYSLNSRHKFQYNNDGSLDIYFQTTTPGKDKAANWIPTPAGDYSVTARLYAPKGVSLSDNYSLPPIMPSAQLAPVSMNHE